MYWKKYHLSLSLNAGTFFSVSMVERRVGKKKPHKSWVKNQINFSPMFLPFIEASVVFVPT